MLKSVISSTKSFLFNIRLCSIGQTSGHKTPSEEYETVFSFPFIKYVAILNRLKVYQIIGTSLAVPGTGILQMLEVFPPGALFSASYIGLTGTALLSLASMPFKNAIGFLYISTDNENIKISSVDFWGNRKDRIVTTEEWIPLLDMEPKVMDSVYLTPQLSDGTKYKLFLKFGQVLNPSKIGKVLE